MRYKVGGPVMSHEARNWARDLDLPGPRGKHDVLKELADHANEYWATWPSKRTLAKDTKLHPNTVSNYLRDLVHEGLIVPVPWRNEEGGDAGSGYFLMGMPDAPNFAPVSVAFRDRRYGFPRGHTPAWWSGEKRNDQTPVQDPLWGEGHTDVTPGSRLCEGEGHTGVRGRVTPVSPLEPSVEPPVEPSIKTSINPLLPVSASAETGTSRSDVLAAADADNRSTADAANRDRSSTVIQMADHRAGRRAGVAGKAAAKPKQPTASQQRDVKRREQIAAMPAGRVEKVVAKYERAYPRNCKWAIDRARTESGLAAIPEDGDDGRDEFLRRVYWWVLKFHNRKQDWPDVLMRAFDEEAMAAEEAEAALRRKRVIWIPCKPGDEDGVLNRMYEAITAMEPAARAEMAYEIQVRKPKVWAAAYVDAQEQLEGDGLAVDTPNHTRLAMQYVVKHYRESDADVKRWPSFTVPPALLAEIKMGGPERAA